MRRDSREVAIEHLGGQLRCERRGLLIEEGGRGVARQEAIRLEDRDQRLAIRDETVDANGTQAACQLRRRSIAIGCLSDDLGEHRVVVRRDHRSGLHTGVDPEPLVGLEALESPRIGEVAARGILGVEAHLDGVTAGCDLRLRARQHLAARHADLPLHQVQAGDHLGHRMLYLKACVHLQEVELLRIALSSDDELHRAGADVANALRKRYRSGVHRVSELSGKPGRG